MERGPPVGARAGVDLLLEQKRDDVRLPRRARSHERSHGRSRREQRQPTHAVGHEPLHDVQVAGAGSGGERAVVVLVEMVRVRVWRKELRNGQVPLETGGVERRENAHNRRVC